MTVARRGKREYRMIAAGGVPGAGLLLPARLLAVAEGYAMIRRRAAASPFIVTEQEWADAPLEGS